MTEHARPEAFPDHLQPVLLPLPETRWEALFLLRRLSDVNLQIRRRREEPHNRGDHHNREEPRKSDGPQKMPGPPPETGHSRTEMLMM